MRVTVKLVPGTQVDAPLTESSPYRTFIIEASSLIIDSHDGVIVDQVKGGIGVSDVGYVIREAFRSSRTP